MVEDLPVQNTECLLITFILVSNEVYTNTPDHLFSMTIKIIEYIGPYGEHKL